MWATDWRHPPHPVPAPQRAATSSTLAAPSATRSRMARSVTRRQRQTIIGNSSVGRPGGRDGPAAERELVFDVELQQHGVAPAREPERRADGELEAAREMLVDRRQHVVLLLARALDGADLADVAVELHAGDEATRETVVDACRVVELDRASLL